MDASIAHPWRAGRSTAGADPCYLAARMAADHDGWMLYGASGYTPALAFGADFALTVPGVRRLDTLPGQP